MLSIIKSKYFQHLDNASSVDPWVPLTFGELASGLN